MADQWNFFADQRIGTALSTEKQSNSCGPQKRGFGGSIGSLWQSIGLRLCWLGAMKTGARNRAERRLAAILAADVAGYSRLVGADEEGTLDRLESIRGELIDPTITAHRGRLVKTTGDGLLVEFASVVDALRCATEVQQAMAGRNAEAADAERLEFRIGINVGDVVVEDGDIFSDGVNVAARLEGLADPGGICVSARVQQDDAGRLDLAFDDFCEQTLKNIARPIRVYRVGVGPRSPLPNPPPPAGEGRVGAVGTEAIPPPAPAFDTAVAKLQASIQERPGFPMSYRALAACYAHMGRLDDAREAIERLRAFTSAIVPPTLPLRNPEHRELFFSGLRLAAGETERPPTFL
jgi:class 3 adenylate cyclase